MTAVLELFKKKRQKVWIEKNFSKKKIYFTSIDFAEISFEEKGKGKIIFIFKTNSWTEHVRARAGLPEESIRTYLKYKV